MTDLVIGLIGSLAIAGAAYRKQSLSGSGVAASVLVGTVLYAYGSIAWFGTLIAFFVSSSLLTKWKHDAKATLEDNYAKTGRRDAGQVFANGGLGVVLCVGNALWPDALWWIAFVGVMAAVNSDTWATEIGALSRTPPRSILTGKKVAPGESGGVSLLGLTASVLGGFFIGTVSWILYSIDPKHAAFPVSNLEDVGWRVLYIAALAGTAGSLFDSILGARWQVMYRCVVCGKEVERKLHCNQTGEKVRGIRILTNDSVNLLSSIVGGLVALLVG